MCLHGKSKAVRAHTEKQQIPPRCRTEQASLTTKIKLIRSDTAYKGGAWVEQDRKYSSLQRKQEESAGQRLNA